MQHDDLARRSPECTGFIPDVPIIRSREFLVNIAGILAARDYKVIKFLFSVFISKL